MSVAAVVVHICLVKFLGFNHLPRDSESELDGEISRNSSRSASFDQDSGGSEPDDGSYSSRQSSSPSPPPTLPSKNYISFILRYHITRLTKFL